MLNRQDFWRILTRDLSTWILPDLNWVLEASVTELLLRLHTIGKEGNRLIASVGREDLAQINTTTPGLWHPTLHWRELKAILHELCYSNLVLPEAHLLEVVQGKPVYTNEVAALTRRVIVLRSLVLLDILAQKSTLLQVAAGRVKDWQLRNYISITKSGVSNLQGQLKRGLFWVLRLLRKILASYSLISQIQNLLRRIQRVEKLAASLGQVIFAPRTERTEVLVRQFLHLRRKISEATTEYITQLLVRVLKLLVKDFLQAAAAGTFIYCLTSNSDIGKIEEEFLATYHQEICGFQAYFDRLSRDTQNR